MPDAVLIIHAPDADMEAAILSTHLNQAGIFAITYRQAVGSSTHIEVQENWDTLVEYVPAFIILASPQLFEDFFLVEMSRDAIAERKGIPVIYGNCDYLPPWFTTLSIHISLDTNSANRGWNRLLEALNKFTAVWTVISTRPN